MKSYFPVLFLLVVVAAATASSVLAQQLPAPANSVWRSMFENPCSSGGMAAGSVEGMATVTENFSPVGPAISGYVSVPAPSMESVFYQTCFWQPQLSTPYKLSSIVSLSAGMNQQIMGGPIPRVDGPPLVFLKPTATTADSQSSQTNSSRQEGATTARTWPRFGVSVAFHNQGMFDAGGSISFIFTNSTGQRIHNTSTGCSAVMFMPVGCQSAYSRNGANSRPASDGNGLTAFSVGVQKGFEFVRVVEQLGDGVDTKQRFLWKFTAPAGATAAQSFISDVVIQNGVAIFSHVSTVYFYSLQTGKLIHSEANPCGFRISSASSVTFNTVSIPGTHGTGREKSDLTLVIVDTTHQHGPDTFGVCAYASVQSATHVTKRFSTLLTNTTAVVFSELISDGGSTGEDGVLLLTLWNSGGKASLRGYSTRSGNMLFNLPRQTKYGILAYPYDLSAAGGANARLFVTNVLSGAGPGAIMQLALVDAGTGRALTRCTETCMVFSVVKGNGGRNIVICQLYGKQVLRGIYFDRSVAGTQCVALWEKSIPTKSPIVGISSEAGEYSTPGGVAQKFVTVVMKDGSTLSVTPDAA